MCSGVVVREFLLTLSYPTPLVEIVLVRMRVPGLLVSLAISE